MLPLHILFIYCSILLFQQVLAATISPRVFTGCVVVNTNLYCYGGYLSAQGGQFIQASTDHYTVDLSTANLTVIKPTLNWTAIPAPAANQGPALEPRANFPITTIDQSRYAILGGATTNATLNTPAILYDSSKNAWEALATPPFYMSNSDMVPSPNGTSLWAYGGTLNSSGAVTPPNTLQLDLSSLPGTWIEHTNSAFPPLTTRHGHAAVIRTTLIYYFGGFFATSATQSDPVPMLKVNFYNTLSDQWGMIVCNDPKNPFCGGENPTNRTHHTATLIYNSDSTPSTKILIYGGAGTDVNQVLPLLDTAFIWDTTTHMYTKVNGTDGDPGPRMGHTAVQYKNNILISFGYDAGGYLRPDTTLLDVSSPAFPSWVGTAPSSSTSPSSPTSPGTDLGGDGGTNNTPAIAGGVVGGVAGIAIIAGIFFYFHRRKKNQLDKNDFDLYRPPQGFHTDNSPTLFTSSDGNRYSDIDNNNADAAIGLGSMKKNNDNRDSMDPVPNYHPIKPDDHLSRVKPSGND